MRVASLISLIVVVAFLIPPLAAAEDDEPSFTQPVAVDVGLDPGHSRVDVGAAGGGLREYELTLEIARRVETILVEHGLAVAMSRRDDMPLTDFSEPDPTDAVMLEQQARVAAVGNAGMYVSIHLNGYSDPRVRGLEVYYNGDNWGDESLSLAGAIHQGLLDELGESGYLVPDRGVKEDLAAGKPYGHFFSLRGPMPSVLVECMFLTNPTEAALLAEEATLDTIARGIADGILEYPLYAMSGTSDQ